MLSLSPATPLPAPPPLPRFVRLPYVGPTAAEERAARMTHVSGVCSECGCGAPRHRSTCDRCRGLALAAD